jgi:hypothetical protein
MVLFDFLKTDPDGKDFLLYHVYSWYGLV